MFRINNDKDIEKFTNHKNTKNLLAKCEKIKFKNSCKKSDTKQQKIYLSVWKH